MAVGVLAGVVAAPASATLTACSGPSAGSHSSVSTRAGLASTRAVYRVVDRSGVTPQVSTLVEDDAAPYVGSILTRSGPPPGGALQGGTAWGAAGLTLLQPDGTAHVVEEAPPGFTGADSHLDVALPLAQRLGWVRRLGAASLDGRACVRWLSGPPLDSGTIGPATSVERTVSWVDAGGRIVGDAWSRNGRVLRTRRLVSLGAGPLLSADGTPAGTAPVPVPTASASDLVRAVPAARLAGLMGVAPPPAPPGLRLDRSVASVRVTTGGETNAESATFTFVRSGELAVVSYTRYLDGTAAMPTDGLPVRLARATGRVTPVLAGLHAQLGTGRGLRLVVTANLPLPAFLAWLRAIGGAPR